MEFTSRRTALSSPKKRGERAKGTAANAVRYYYAGATRLAMRWGSGNVTWLLGDHLGSTSVSYDGTNELHQGYKPWGETRFGDVQTPYQFTGQYRQASLGLDFFNARWYDSALGRFVQADSIIPEASQGVQAWDRYAGMNNNPVRYNDPTGHDVGCPGQSSEQCAPLQPLPPGGPLAPSSTPRPPVPQFGNPPLATSTPNVPRYVPGPSPTPTPSTVSSTNNPVVGNNKPTIDIEINWSKVDYFDLAIDGIGVFAEAVGGIAALTGVGAPVTVYAEYVQAGVETIGFGKSVVDVVQGDPQNLLMQQTTSTAERVVVLVFRLERILPAVGLIGNAVSVYINLDPQITIDY